MNKTLKDCCSFQEGYVNPSQKNREYFGDAIRWLRAVDLNNDEVFETSERLSEKGFKSAGASALMFTKNSLAISKSGSIGTLGILRNEMCGNRAVINIKVNDTADLDYIFYLLKYKNKEIVTKAVGSIQKNLYVSELETIELCHDNIEIQRNISKVLKSIDERIRNNKAIFSTLESLAKTIYDYWFVQFDFPDENGKPYKSSGGKMVWNEELKREIPEGWEVRSVGDIACLQTESMLPVASQTYHHYSIPSFDDSRTPLREEGDSIASNKYIVPNNCVLVSKLNPQFKRLWPIINPMDNGISSTEFLPLVAEKTGLPYLYSVLNSDAYSTHLKQNASSSTGSRKRIDPKDCLSYIFPFDSITARKYNEQISCMFESLLSIPQCNQQLASLRDFLLPMLMNGQVKVEEVSKQ